MAAVPPSGWDKIKAPFLVVSVITAAIIGVIGVATNWYGLQEKRRCSFSGVASDRFTGQPVQGVKIGYAPNNPRALLESQLDFRPLATSQTGGAFAGSCEDAHEEGGNSTVELLVMGRFRGMPGGLPCLRARRTGVRIKETSKQEGVNLDVPSC